MENFSTAIIEPGVCSVCGDKSAGKHYGVVACYGCKGFFRRTIRSKQTYSCRFQQRCRIDKDQRNACRYCRFARCIQVGMEVAAIRPDRDVIGKQKNPRKRKLLMIKTEENSLPSLRTDSNSSYSQQEDMLLNFLLEVDLRGNNFEMSTETLQLQPFDAGNMNVYNDVRIDDTDNDMSLNMGQQISLAIGIATSPQAPLFRPRMIKSEPEVTLASLFQDPTVLEQYRKSLRNVELGTPANIEKFSEAMRRYVLMCADWINSLFMMSGMDGCQEKLSMLRNSFATFCTFEQATRTAIMSRNLNSYNQQQSLVLCNGAIIPRDFSRELIDTNLLSNNIVGRILDELVQPIRQLSLSDQERVVLTALIILEGDSRSSIYSENNNLYLMKDRLQHALFQHVRERCENSVNRAGSRFASILLLLPSIARVSAIYLENAQLAKMFGRHSLDPLLAEIFLDSFNMTASSTPGSSGPLSADALSIGGGQFIGMNTGQREQFAYASATTNTPLLLTTLPSKSVSDAATQTMESSNTSDLDPLQQQHQRRKSVAHMGQQQQSCTEFFLNNAIGIATPQQNQTPISNQQSSRKSSAIVNTAIVSPPHTRHNSGGSVATNISSSISSPVLIPTSKDPYNANIYYQQHCAYQQQNFVVSPIADEQKKIQLANGMEGIVPINSMFSDNNNAMISPHTSPVLYRQGNTFFNSNCSPVVQQQNRCAFNY